ncbi:transglutaminase-like domain-containing protein [Thauera sinica]|nr:transglutaminase domain-containing protein [Thauera sp. K11]
MKISFPRCVVSILLAASAASAQALCLDTAEDPLLCETREIRFRGEAAQVLRNKAAALGNAADIYAYLRNHAEYTPYYGARSDSINSFGGLVGNDVDLASTLIAMLRSQGIKARYALGSATIQKNPLANQLRVDNIALLPTVLGSQGVIYTANTDTTMTIERTWVEALVPYRAYRGAAPATCAAESVDCRWVALDPSFKQKRYAHPDKHLLLRDVGFDFTAYYNADNPASPNHDASLKNKNPITIFEEKAQAYLKANHAGVTLDDVADVGEIVADDSGLLPASLPFAATTTGRYPSVDDHDAAISTRWRRMASVTLEVDDCGDTAHVLPSAQVPLAVLASSRLTFGTLTDGGQTRFGFQLDGVQQGSTVTLGSQQVSCTDGSTRTLGAGSRVTATVSFDNIDQDSAAVSAKYDNLTIGGYFVLATGAEVSNWDQVKRAYTRLNEANDQYPLVVDSGGAVYVDRNGNGAVDTGDTLLGNHAQAREALVGGLLDVASRLYVRSLKHSVDRYTLLTNHIDLLQSSGGILSTAQAAHYLGETSFGIAPEGLLIDLQAYQTGGTYKRETVSRAPSSTFLFVGHALSAHEHEVWQKVTGLDAISTLRGFQTSLSQGHSLLTLKRSTSVDPLPAALDAWRFKSTPPAGYTPREYTLFGRRIYTWEYTGSNPAAAGLDIIRANASGVSASVLNAEPDQFWVSVNVQSVIKSYDDVENFLLERQPSEGQPKTNIQTDVGTQNYDIVRADVTSPPSGFSVGVSRLDSTTHRLTYNEKNPPLPDNTYNILTRLYLATSNKTTWDIPIPAQGYSFTLTGMTSSNPAFRVVSYPSQIPYNTAATARVEKIAYISDTDNLVIQLVASGMAYNQSGTPYIVNNNAIGGQAFWARENRVIEGLMDFALNGVNTSDAISIQACNGQTFSGTPTQLLSSLRTQCFEPAIAGAIDLIDFLDRNKGFNPSLYLFRDAATKAANEYPVRFLKSLQGAYYGAEPGLVEYVLPSRMPQGDGYLFNVHLLNEFNSDGSYKSSSYAISNQSDAD